MLPTSIRGRLLLWFGALTFLSLGGVGWAVVQLHRVQRADAADAELERMTARLSTVYRSGSGPRGGPGGPRRPGMFPPREGAQGAPTNAPPGAPWEFGPPPGFRPDRPFTDAPPNDRPMGAAVREMPAELKAFDSEDPTGIYFAIWDRGGGLLHKSPNTPQGGARPDPDHPDRPGPSSTAIQLRTRGALREAYHFTERGDCILSGRNLAADLAEERRFGLGVALATLAVFLLGLGGGAALITGALRPIDQISAAALRISAGQLDKRIDVDERASELGRLIQVLNATFARLEASFAQQKQFTADASHELRTPLAAIIVDLQATLSRPREAEDYRTALERSLGTAQQLKRLSAVLLDLARLDAGQAGLEHSPVNLAEIASGCLDAIRPVATGAGVRLEQQLAPAQSSGDADRLFQVVLNLLSNAVRYNHPGGAVRVSTGQEGGFAFLTVSDTGCGIEAADLPNIFRRFYRAASSRTRADGGVGLGLAIAKAIVDAHGGTIHAASKAGHGATFTVLLPAAA